MNTAINIIVTIFLFLLPLFFLPFTADYFEINKQLLLMVTTLTLTILSIITIFKKKRITLFLTPFSLPLILLNILFILSMLLRSPYRFGSLISPLGVLTFSSAILLHLLLTQKDQPSWPLKWIGYSMIASGLILSFLTFTSFLFNIPQFTPAGTPYFAFLFLPIPFVYALVNVIRNIVMPNLFRHPNGILKQVQHDNLVNVFLLLSTALIGLTLVVLIFKFQKTGLNILPFSYGIDIAKDGLKSPPTLLLGTGPGQFISTFTFSRPLAMNMSAYWNVLFSSSSNFLLTLTAEIGLPGSLLFLLIFVLLIFLALKDKSIRNHPLFVPLLVLFLIQSLTLSSITLLVYTLVFLALISPKKKIFEYNFEHHKLLRWPVAIIPLLICVFAFILVGRWYGAEVIFQKSLAAFSQNQGRQVYNLELLSIKLNPYLDRYHSSFAQTNLALANSLSSQKDLTDEEKQMLPRLFDQAISESRYATFLNPTSIINWTNLAEIYQAISKFVRGADGKTIETYQQIEKLAPSDPQTRLSLGNFYYSIGNLDQAGKQFEEAITLKPDWASPHYNLATIEKKRGNLQKAYSELTRALQLLAPAGLDYAKVNADLDEVQQLLATSSASPTKEK